MIPPPTPNRLEKSPAARPMTTSRHQAALPAATAGLLASPAMALPDEITRALAPLRERLPVAAVLLDLDGTLAPIRPRPEDVVLSPDVRRAVAELRGRAQLVGLVSGRALEDLERIVGLPGCAYAGNHGLEIRRPDGRREVVAEVRPFIACIAEFAARWGPEQLDPYGVRLENKGVTLSFHYRTAPDARRAQDFLDREVAPAARAAGLRVTQGRKVVEVRPPVAVNKGTAVRELVAGSGCRAAAYLGDDVTDLDAWAALRAMARDGAVDFAVAVAVVDDETPQAVAAAADVALPGTVAVLDLLRWLAASAG
jgi:trehalose 6-phosphate phosphatase